MAISARKKRIERKILVVAEMAIYFII